MSLPKPENSFKTSFYLPWEDILFVTTTHIYVKKLHVQQGACREQDLLSCRCRIGTRKNEASKVQGWCLSRAPL